MLDIDNSTSYATEANLHKAIARRFGANVSYLVVCNRKGRFTAIFGASWNKLPMVHIASAGFKVIG